MKLTATPIVGPSLAVDGDVYWTQDENANRCGNGVRRQKRVETGSGDKNEMVKGAQIVDHDYTYDPATGRLVMVNDVLNNVGASYTYAANSDALAMTTLFSNGAARMTTSRTLDALGRTKGVVNTPAAYGILFPAAASHTYTYDAFGDRDLVTLEDGSSWDYTYDDKGQVTGGKRGTSLVPPLQGKGHTFTYGFDQIGNRTTTGDTVGQRTYAMSESADAKAKLNQYSNRTTPNAVSVMGRAANGATVWVNSVPAESLGAGLWHKLLDPRFDNNAVHGDVNIIGQKPGGGAPVPDVSTQRSGKYYLAPNPEPYTYDADGNMTGDGRWLYTWDGENRLIKMEPRPWVPASAKLRLIFKYDGFSRRIEKKVEGWATDHWQLTTAHLFCYDGWNLVAEVNVLANNAATTFLWGKDVSGSLQGAGGVGGLLWQSGAEGKFATGYDGNGNITAVTDANGTLLARPDYGPFGEPIAPSPLRHGFSTKYQDTETGLLYYGYRYYNPTTGRWINRDPIGERGGVNLYGMIGNRASQFVDGLGLEIVYNQLFFAKDQDVGRDDEIGRIRFQIDAEGIMDEGGKSCKPKIKPANNQWDPDPNDDETITDNSDAVGAPVPNEDNCLSVKLSASAKMSDPGNISNMITTGVGVGTAAFLWSYDNTRKTKWIPGIGQTTRAKFILISTTTGAIGGAITGGFVETERNVAVSVTVKVCCECVLKDGKKTMKLTATPIVGPSLGVDGDVYWTQDENANR